MNARSIAAAALTLVTVALLLVEVISWPQSARFGPSLTTGTRCSALVSSVSNADQAAGLRDGDALVLPQMDVPSRSALVYRFAPTQAGRAGDTIGLVVQRGNRQLKIPYLLRHTDSVARFIAQLGFKLFLLLLGIFVLWRGRDRASLMLGIWCLGVAIALPDSWWGALDVNGRLAGGA